MFGERLAASRQRAGLRQVELAVALGDRYSQSMISMVETGQRELRADGVMLAARELDVSTDYLYGLTDTPAPAATLAAKVSELDDASARPRSDTPHAGIHRIALTEDTAALAAGSGIAADEYVVDYVPFRDDWLSRHNLKPAHCQVTYVSGRSMEPTLQHRAVVLVDFQRTVRRHNKIFAVRTEDGPVVKRLQRDEDGWQLVSDNKNYKPVPWPQDAVVLGQVMWTGRTL